jgi:hypothetical protein
VSCDGEDSARTESHHFLASSRSEGESYLFRWSLEREAKGGEERGEEGRGQE